VTRSFAVNWDYRCPFARIAHEEVVTGLEGGADWDVRFVSFALDQPHVEQGASAAWERFEEFPGLLANLAGIVARDRYPDRFLEVHKALFDARHVERLDLRQRDIVAKVLADTGADESAILAEVDAGWPLEVLGREHTEWVSSYSVFGVPTFLVDDQAVFVRLMSHSEGDPVAAIAQVERALDLITGFPGLNEFKHTTIPY
jgi:DSBA-like thioredoxin domain